MKLNFRILPLGLLGASLLSSLSSHAAIKIIDSGSEIRVLFSEQDAGRLMDSLKSTRFAVASDVALSCNRVRSLSCVLSLKLGQRAGLSVYRDSIRVGRGFEEPAVIAELTATSEAEGLYDTLDVPARSAGNGGHVKNLFAANGAFRIDCSRYGSLSYCGITVLLGDQ